ncbi:MAG: ABC transporter substrate-binding protein [Leptolyngbyaceae cyanobacterium SL_1_1]|nr:ABC transporter substrate-binding protein [Leptolyngbyaceae cyanobacterium RM1_1_2]NJO10751.1 ABC transporter substrate-binding protein [Leptolyngbyaceae cyanobacterium SL_1_1]
MAQTLRSLLICFILISGLILSGCQPAANGDIVRLTLWQGISPPSNRDVFQTLVQRFNAAHPQIEIESLYVGQPDQQIPKILTAVVGNAAPDLLWYVPTLTGQLVELEAIQPLDDWWQRSPFRDQLDPALTETMSLEDHIWSVPFATNNAAVFYRPSLFKAAGIEQIPQTWEDFRAAAQRLTQDTDDDGRADQHGIFLSLGKGEWTVFVWLPFVYSAGGQIAAGTQPDLVNSGAIAALQLGADLVRSGSAVLSAPERGFEIDSFIAGKVAMQVTGPWTLPQLQDSGIDFDVFPFPVSDRPAAVVGGESFFLGKTTPEKTQAAYKFLDYVLSPEFQQTWALETGYLPANITVRNSDTYQQFVQDNPSLQVFLKQMDWARSRPIIPGYTYLSENFGRAIEASLLGTSPEEALKQSQKRLQLILQE